MRSASADGAGGVAASGAATVGTGDAIRKSRATSAHRGDRTGAHHMRRADTVKRFMARVIHNPSPTKNRLAFAAFRRGRSTNPRPGPHVIHNSFMRRVLTS